MMRNLLNKIFCNKQAKTEFQKSKEWTTSSNYWEERYVSGGNSGIGSYGRLAEYKAEILNQFVEENNISTVIEWGCGDGNQLLLADYPKYLGLDVSKEAIRICSEMFKNDITKSFLCITEDSVFDEEAELALSLDVIYHLIEDDVYENYMRRLFASSRKYVCIYSCNDEEKLVPAIHVKHRKFTDWIDKNVHDKWKMRSHIRNKYPYDPNIPESSWSDFYFFETI